MVAANAAKEEICVLWGIVRGVAHQQLRDDFIGARVKDSCNGSWPVCNQTASCFIGNQSYIEGRFPGQGKIIAGEQHLSNSDVKNVKQFAVEVDQPSLPNGAQHLLGRYGAPEIREA